MFQNILQFIGNTWYALIPVAVIAYLLGSVSFAIIVTKLYAHQDIRDFGSGNAGATNVLRSQGKWPALFTGIGDLGKSLLSISIGSELFCRLISETYPNTAHIGIVGAYTAGVFCIIGHLFPLYFGFRGGKGVITAFGLYLMLDYRVALAALAAFVVTVAISKMVSLGSVIGCWVAPIATIVFYGLVDREPVMIVTFCTVVSVAVAVILTVKHRTNIRRIKAGTESKLSFRKN